MPDVVGTFELAKLQWRFSRVPPGGLQEDSAVMTFHFIKSGSPTIAWEPNDVTAIEAQLDLFWAELAPNYADWFSNDQYRWYRDGPAYYELIPEEDPYHYQPKGDNPAFLVTENQIPGTSTTPVLPPQLAATITEKTSTRGSWGRFYLPNPIVSIADVGGRISPIWMSDVIAAAGAFYGNCKSAGTPVVVWSIQKPERPKKSGGMLGPEQAKALEVTELVMDNTFDVIRRRRWDNPTQRVNASL